MKSAITPRHAPPRNKVHLSGCMMAWLFFGYVSHAAAETDREYCERQQGPAKIVCMRNLKQAPIATKADAAPAGSATDSDRAYCERQQGSAKVACIRQLSKTSAPSKNAAAASDSAAASGGESGAATGKAKAANQNDSGAASTGAALYKVVDGYHVDADTLKGFRTWRAAACDRCHGANQEGLVGPSLVTSLKTLSKADFIKTVTNGRLEKGMPSFGADKNLTSNIDNLYAYLKGRSDGAITKSHVEPIQ